MITRDQISPIGSIAKTHGVRGDMNIRFDIEVDLDAVRALILDIDGIFVPFFVDDWRFRSDDTAIVHIEDIDTEPEARALFGKTVFVLNDDIDNDAQDSLASYIGCTLIGNNGESIGRIADFDDSTANLLFILDNDALIPIASINILNSDVKARILTVELPEGLLDL